MQRAHHAAVPKRSAQTRNLFHEFLIRYFCQDFFSKIGSRLFHLHRNCGILVAHVGVTLSGIDDQKVTADRIQTEIDLFHLRILVISKIDRNNAAARTRHLVKQSGRLFPIDIFRIASCMCIVCDGHFIIVKEVIQNRTDQHFKGRRRADARRADHIACGERVKAAYRKSSLLKTGKDSLDQRHRAGGLCIRLQLVQINDKILMERFADNMYLIGIIFARRADTVLVHTACKHLSMIVIGMVAADLCAPRRGKQFKFHIAEILCKSRRKLTVALHVLLYVVLSVQVGK